ncbi:MAG: DHHA1 domain-containing protein, partial [Candidatus Sumerlaeia bacterium]|nr:DHHA1 domain-containing protein [Candidatus Sumerlaeia bacterium]
TGLGAVAEVQRQRAILRQIGKSLSASGENIPARIEGLQREIRDLRKALEQARESGSANVMEKAIAEAADIGGLKVIVARLDDMDPDGFRKAADLVRSKCQKFVAVLAGTKGDRATLLAAVDKESAKKISAKELVAEIGAPAGLRGGGRPELAQAGGPASAALDDTLAKVANIVRDKMQTTAR